MSKKYILEEDDEISEEPEAPVKLGRPVGAKDKAPKRKMTQAKWEALKKAQEARKKKLEEKKNPTPVPVPVKAPPKVIEEEQEVEYVYKKKPKKKVIVMEESSSDEEVIVKKPKKKVKKQVEEFEEEVPQVPNKRMGYSPLDLLIQHYGGY